MKNFFIIANRAKDEALKAQDKLYKYILDKGGKATIDSTNYSEKDGYYTDSSLIPEDAECVIVLGGDGTMLHAAADLIDCTLPFLGINLGTLGYLAEVDSDGMYDAIDRLLLDDYTTNERMMLDGICISDSKDSFCDSALNEIVITGSKALQMVYVDIYVNDKLLHHYTADGIIVATPTGSTGYSLSAGGPIVNPDSNMLIVTPICSHSMHNRSIVFSQDDEIRIDICDGRFGNIQNTEVVFDGGSRVTLKTGDSVKIKRSLHTLKIVKLNELSFLDTLHNKLKDN